MSDVLRVRERFAIDESIVSAYGDEQGTTIAERRARWTKDSRHKADPPEQLLARIVRQIRRNPPSFMVEPKDALGRSRARLEAEVTSLEPWLVPFPLDHGVTTLPAGRLSNVVRERLSFRRDLILGTLEDLLGGELDDTSVLDIGCNSGIFSLDAAARGAAHVDGIDLRARNIEQASFLAQHYAIHNVNFATTDIADLAAGKRWDVVLNLGVLYHVTDPLQLVRRTFDLCRRFAILDTVCSREPVSGFFVTGDRDVESLVEGRDSMELVPTYRAVIDLLWHAGFSEVFEIVGIADRPHRSYAEGRRRCFLAVK